MLRKTRTKLAREAFEAAGLQFEIKRERTQSNTVVELTATIDPSKMAQAWVDARREFEKRFGAPLFTNTDDMMSAWRAEGEKFNTLLTRNDFYNAIFCSFIFAAGEK